MIRAEGARFWCGNEMITENIVVGPTRLRVAFGGWEWGGAGPTGWIVRWLHFYFASAVAAMKDAEILKRFLIILCVFREDVRIKYNK